MSSFINTKKTWNTNKLRKFKSDKANKTLSMLTCYDFQTATLLDETPLDLILVGDSLGNVILGKDSTVEVTLEEMIIFGSAVRRGALNKYLIVDMPFGTYSLLDKGISNALKLYSFTKADAIKIEGAYPHIIEIIKRVTQSGVPIMGHIGLTPQSVGQLGGYYTHGKTKESADRLIKEAKDLEAAGCFSIVLECVKAEVAEEITKQISIPTIGIGAGEKTDGQVLVINDLLGMGPYAPPSFCKPIDNLYEQKKQKINVYLNGFLKDDENFYHH